MWNEIQYHYANLKWASEPRNLSNSHGLDHLLPHTQFEFPPHEKLKWTGHHFAGIIQDVPLLQRAVLLQFECSEVQDGLNEVQRNTAVLIFPIIIIIHLSIGYTP